MLYYVKDSDLNQEFPHYPWRKKLRKNSVFRKLKTSPTILILLAISLCLLLGFAIIFPFVITRGTESRCQSIATYSASVRFPYLQLTTGLQDETSEEYSEFSKDFCASLNEGGFSDAINDCNSATDSCRVSGLSGGSLVVKMLIRQLKSSDTATIRDRSSFLVTFIKTALQAAIDKAKESGNSNNLFSRSTVSVTGVDYIESVDFTQCHPLYLPEGTTIFGSTSETNLVGDTVKIICDKNYQFPDGSVKKYLDCTSTGSWNTSVSACYTVRDCSDLQKRGLYNPDGDNYVTINDRRILVRCTSNGWTIIQHREDGSIPFEEKTYAEYVEGFRSATEIWMGLADQYTLLSSTSIYHIRIWMEVRNDTYYRSEYNSYALGDAASKYRLSVGSLVGFIDRRKKRDAPPCTNSNYTEALFSSECNGGPGFYDSLGAQFHTNDNDSFKNCTDEAGGGGWWIQEYTFGCLTVSNLNNAFEHMFWLGGNGVTATTMSVKRREDIDDNFCDLNPCQNGGTCYHWFCDCVPPYTGVLCTDVGP